MKSRSNKSVGIGDIHRMQHLPIAPAPLGSGASFNNNSTKLLDISDTNLASPPSILNDVFMGARENLVKTEIILARLSVLTDRLIGSEGEAGPEAIESLPEVAVDRLFYQNRVIYEKLTKIEAALARLERL